MNLKMRHLNSALSNALHCQDQFSRYSRSPILDAIISLSPCHIAWRRGECIFFEQYQDLYATLGLSASHDDLQTDDSASASLKKQSGTFSDLTAQYGFAFDKRNRSFMPTEGSIIGFNQYFPIYADKAYIANQFSASAYNEFSEKLIGASKLFISTAHGLSDDDVRLSRRQNLSTKRLRDQYPLHVKQGEYYVLGDNRMRSVDSRNWGTISANSISGKVSIVYWPIKDWKIIKNDQ